MVVASANDQGAPNDLRGRVGRHAVLTAEIAVGRPVIVCHDAHRVRWRVSDPVGST
jgi:hypothetical protein